MAGFVNEAVSAVETNVGPNAHAVCVSLNCTLIDSLRGCTPRAP